MELVIDDREHKLFTQFDAVFAKSGLRYCKERLDIGDYMIRYKINNDQTKNNLTSNNPVNPNLNNTPGVTNVNLEEVSTTSSEDSIINSEMTTTVQDNSCDKILAVIERKSLNDYAASFKDGRHENREKLVKLREHTNCKVYYLIEGPINPKLTRKFQRIPYSNILCSIDNLVIVNDFHIIRTVNTDHTVDRLKFLLQSYTKKQDILLPEMVEGGSQILLDLKPTKEEKLNRCVYEGWAKIPWVSIEFAKVLYRNFTLYELFNNQIDYNVLTELTLPSGRSPSKKTFDKIKNWNKIEGLAEKILSCCPQLTLSTIAKIKSQISIEELLSDLDQNKIANLQKTDNRKIGKVLAENIINYLNYQFTEDNE